MKPYLGRIIAIISLFIGVLFVYIIVTAPRVSQVFTTIDSGLNPGGSSRSGPSSWSAEAAPTMRSPMTVQPAAPAATAAPELPELPQDDTQVRFEVNQPQQQ